MSIGSSIPILVRRLHCAGLIDSEAHTITVKLMIK